MFSQLKSNYLRMMQIIPFPVSSLEIGQYVRITLCLPSTLGPNSFFFCSPPHVQEALLTHAENSRKTQMLDVFLTGFLLVFIQDQIFSITGG